MSICVRYFRVPNDLLEEVISERDDDDCEDEPSTSSSYTAYPSLSLDKAWDMLHLFLTGAKEETGEPLSKAIHGNGEAVGDESDGVYYLLPAEVNEIAHALKAQDPEALAARVLAMDAEELDELEIYSFDSDDVESAVLEARCNFDLTREFYESAAAAGEGVIFNVG